ncbi:MAG: hypothetical protein KDJ36_09830, partial [Hyphomicrobiaceae bacterium]|nr:hypothetical protein [Hyphomicrobiaceae bacterium]
AAVAAAAAKPLDRFGQALAGDQARASQPAPPAQHYEPTAARIETIPDRPQSTPVSKLASDKERHVTATPIVTPGNDTVTADVEVGQPLFATIAAPAAATIIPSGSPTATTAEIVPAAGAAPAAAPAGAASADDLMAIRGVTEDDAALLRRHGFGSFGRIAAMSATDVDRIEGVLAAEGRISRENWIEQAGLLSGGGRTAYARQRAAAGATVVPIAVTEPRVAAEPPKPEPVTTRPQLPDDLALVRGIDGATSAALAAAGVTTFAQIAGWGKADVARIDAALGNPGRIARENWIEQASMLAAGKATQHARLRQQGAPSVAQTPQGDQGSPVRTDTPAPATPAADVTASLAAAAAAAAAAALAGHATTEQTLPNAAVADRDDLTRISGVSPEVERMLNARGITRYSQIASMSPGDIARVEGYIGASGRIAREDWVGQARSLSGLPAPGDQLATAAGTGLAGLRSVRSEAYTAAGGPAARGTSPISGPADDLKRIRGVGVLIEKKLRMLGVNSYDQIANWTSADIDRVSQHLDFRGRIERENWVEQARILVAGGETQFSRRFDTQTGGHSGGTASDET